jgi:hypothetical protein
MGWARDQGSRLLRVGRPGARASRQLDAQNGYEKAINYLPHDGVNSNGITRAEIRRPLGQAGFKVEPPVKNQGKGAASMRVEAVRRLGPKMWFNAATTESGRQALGFYHEKKDENRNVGLGPDHDWSSHAADSFGLMAVCYEEPGRAAASTGRSATHAWALPDGEDVARHAEGAAER